MLSSSLYSPSIGTVICPKNRPATPLEVWVELLPSSVVSLHDLLLIDSPGQQLLGSVIDIQLVEEYTSYKTTSTLRRRSARHMSAKLGILSSSDGRQRPPEGTIVRWPRASEVTTMLAEARHIPSESRVPLGVISMRDGFAPVYCHLDRLVGPTATSMLITGAAGSYKSSAGGLAICGVAQATKEQAALVIINSKGEDLLFLDFARQSSASKFDVRPLTERDLAIYRAMGYDEPPVLHNLTAFVPSTNEATWQSARPQGFPRTRPYNLSRDVAIRYACAPTDEDEKTSSVVTRQCIEEAAGPFAQELGLTTLAELVDALTEEFEAMGSERSRWRNQFQGRTVAAALRQLQATVRDIGPLLSTNDHVFRFPVEELAQGGTWVIDIAPLPQRAAQAVLDEVVAALWRAKAIGIIPHDLPLVLLCDELNRWSSRGVTASRLAAIVRDQRHRCFSLIGLAQSLSSLHPQMLDNVDALWIGNTRSRELAEEVYSHIPPHLRNQLHRLPTGTRLLDAPPLAMPQIIELPFPSYLIANEGLAVVEAWRERN
jgi:uncharacterized protein